MLLRLLSLWTALVLRLLGARGFRRRYGDIRLAGFELGPPGGEPWILLHGLGSTSLSWYPVLRALRRECRLVVPELSALGGTAGHRAGLDVRQGALAVAALAEGLFPGRRVTLAGLSLGAWIAVRLALDRPELAARLVLVDAAGYRDQDWQRIERLVRVQTVGDVDVLYRALFHRTPWIFRVSRRAFLAAFTSPAVLDILEDLGDVDVFGDEHLARLRLPVAVIWGEQDGLFEAAVARRMAAALPDARLALIPGCGHAVHWECPGRLVAAVQAFRHQTSLAAARAT